MEMKIENFQFEYTGGGVWIMAGTIGEEWFIFDNIDGYLDMVDENYFDIGFENGDDAEWFDEHHTRTPDEEERKSIIHAVYKMLTTLTKDEFLLDTVKELC